MCWILNGWRSVHNISHRCVVIASHSPGGDIRYMDRFRMDKMTGELWLEESIDREDIVSVNLIVKASEDCWSRQWEGRHDSWNISDASTLLVQVIMMDINDNPPQFTRDWFTAGVTKDTQFGEEVLDLSVSSKHGNGGKWELLKLTVTTILYVHVMYFACIFFFF